MITLIRDLRFFLFFSISPALFAQSVQTLPTFASLSSGLKIPTGSTSATAQLLLDAAQTVDIEVDETLLTQVELISPTGNVFNLSGNGGQFTGLSYSVATDPSTSSSRTQIRLVSPQAGTWQVLCSLSSAASTDVGIAIICYFSNGPRTLFYVPRSTILGQQAIGYLFEEDNDQPIMGTVTAQYALDGDPNFIPQPLTVVYDGSGYKIDLSSLPAVGNFNISFSITGSGSTGAFVRNGGGPVKVVPAAATYAGTYSVKYYLSYGNR